MNSLPTYSYGILQLTVVKYKENFKVHVTAIDEDVRKDNKILNA